MWAIDNFQALFYFCFVVWPYFELFGYKLFFMRTISSFFGGGVGEPKLGKSNLQSSFFRSYFLPLI